MVIYNQSESESRFSTQFVCVQKLFSKWVYLWMDLGYTTWRWLYVNHDSADEIVPNDRFVLKIETQDEGSLQADARAMIIGKKKAAGLGRYVVRHRSKSNVVVVRKEDRVQTWGFKVRSGLEIMETTEIFYWQKCFSRQNQVDDVYYKHRHYFILQYISFFWNELKKKSLNTSMIIIHHTYYCEIYISLLFIVI